GGGVAMERWPPCSRLIALRRLDLDDLGTVVAEHLRAIRPAEHAREIDYLDAGQRAGFCLGHVVVPILRVARRRRLSTRRRRWRRILGRPRREAARRSRASGLDAP